MTSFLGVVHSVVLCYNADIANLKTRLQCYYNKVVTDIIMTIWVALGYTHIRFRKLIGSNYSFGKCSDIGVKATCL